MGIEQRYLSSKELSQYLGIAMQTVYEWTSQKKIPHMKLGRLLRFDKQVVDALMKTKIIKPYAN